MTTVLTLILLCFLFNFTFSNDISIPESLDGDTPNTVLNDEDKPCRCEIDLSVIAELGKHPIFYNPKTASVIYPTYETNIFKLETGESFELHCPKLGILVNEENIVAGKLEVTCLYGHKFTARNRKFDIRGVRCLSRIRTSTRLTELNCGKHGQEIDVGVALIELEFIKFYTICFDFKSQIAEFARSQIIPVVTWSNHIKEVRKCNDIYYSLPQLTYIYYNPLNTDKVLNAQTGKIGFNRWVISRNRLLRINRFYLAPPTDFFYKYEKMSTQLYINIVPHFGVINWTSLRMFLRLYAMQNRVNLEIYTGTFLKMKLQHEGTKQKVPIFLDYVTKKIPIPEIIWMVAMDKRNNAGIAFIGINNFMTKNSYSMLCPDISRNLPWMGNNLRKYVYACTIKSWYDVVNYAFPNFFCSSILGANFTDVREDEIDFEFDPYPNETRRFKEFSSVFDEDMP